MDESNLDVQRLPDCICILQAAIDQSLYITVIVTAQLLRESLMTPRPTNDSTDPTSSLHRALNRATSMGRQVAPMGVKLGKDKGTGPRKLKILLKLY